MTDEEKEECAGWLYADWLDAVKADGKNIEDVPEKFKTVELCAEAVENYTYLLDDLEIDSENLSYVYDYYFRLRNPEFYKQVIKAVKEKKEGKGAFKYIPEHIREEVTAKTGKESNMDDRRCVVELLGKSKSVPLLTKEEERLLLKNRNAPEARQKLIDANLRFVLRLALQYKDKAPMPALLEAGKKGLIEAIEKYDCEKKRIGFISYAVWWIRAFIVSVIPKG